MGFVVIAAGCSDDVFNLAFFEMDRERERDDDGAMERISEEIPQPTKKHIKY